LKKAFIILTLLVAFNLTAPNNQSFSQTARHIIEYTQEDKTPNLTNNVLLKNKVVMYLRMHVLMIQVASKNTDKGFNTS
jgi:hypothetical protein